MNKAFIQFKINMLHFVCCNPYRIKFICGNLMFYFFADVRMDYTAYRAVSL